MSKHLWMVNHHALVPSKDGGAGRHLNMARYLPKHGWTASLIIASTNHARGSQEMPGLRLRKITNENDVPVLWIRASAYGTSMIRRLIGMFVFAIVALVPGVTKGLQRPDAVVGSTVHLLAAWVGLRLAKRHGVPFIYEIRDVWPDTLVHLGRMKSTGMLARSMERLSVTLARKSSIVLSPLPHMDRYLSDHNIDTDKFLWVSNGFDGTRESVEPTHISGNEFVFMYLGAHGNVNALDEIMDSFDKVCSSLPSRSLRLRFVGSGPLKPQLLEYSRSLPCSNFISFEDRIPQSEVIERAREADCLLASMHDNPVYKYGVSPNKLFTYLFAHRPVVFACNESENPIGKSGGGIVVPSSDTSAFADAMIEVVKMSEANRDILARNGYDHVLANYTYDVLAGELAAGLAKLLGQQDELEKS